METVNVQIRTFDKATGAIVDDQPLASFFGASSGGDPYVVYDDTAGRWYVIAFDSSDSGLFLKVSNDANPLDGWGQTFDLTNVGGFPDYPKMGFNKDAIFIGYNDFGSGGGAATIVAINKADAIAGVLTTNIIHPDFSQFRAIPPAQMHGDTTGGTEWFVSVEESGGNTLQVTKLTDYFSATPSIHTTMLPVTAFSPPSEADQPGGTWTIFPNTTTTQVQYRNGHLVTAMASGSASDNFFNPKGFYYQVNVTSGTPVLLQQGIIDPGPGVSVQMPSVAEDINGNLGFTWMEASPTEFLSMYVGTLNTSGQFTAVASAPGGGFFDVNFRIGDYSSTVIDESDGTTFWSANEYIGSDGSSNIWKTHLTSFTIPPAQDNDWYSIDVHAGTGYSLFTQSYTPSDQGGQFINQVSVNIELYDTFGNLVAVGSDVGDGHNQSIFFNAPVTGRYFIHVFNSPGTSGEYFLSVDTASFQSGAIAGQVYNDLNGDGSNGGGTDPGLNGWEVDVYDSSGNFVASQLTNGNGNYDIAGLPAGTYTVYEVLQAGWTQTAPVPDYFWTVTVTAGATASGNDFGDFQNLTISGEKFNDLNGNGVQDAGDPGLPGWTIDLLDASGAIVATTVTDDSGNFSFTDVGPGTYTVQEELQAGWIQTFPPLREPTRSRPPAAAISPA